MTMGPGIEPLYFDAIWRANPTWGPLAMRTVVAAIFSAIALFIATSASASTLDKVRSRGFLICGTNPATAGFSMPGSNGKWTGFMVDYCRAVAAAVLGDASRVRFIPVNTKERFTALQSGEIDILAHNVTWSSSRDTSLGLLFAATIFYDGQGFMVKKEDHVASAKDLNGATICVSQGTTAELNIADYFRARGMRYNTLAFADEQAVIRAFERGRCDVYSADTSSLNAARMQMAHPESSAVLPELISKEPLAPVVRQGDDQWFNIAKWTLFVMLSAEEYGVSSANVDANMSSRNPNVRRLLGVEGNIGKNVGLGPKWTYNVIRQVGNYAEIFERNIGRNSPLKIPRGMNALYSHGGLQYSPPIR